MNRALNAGTQSTLNIEYRLYCELRDKAFSDVKDLVREYMEKQSSSATSYQFMNIYGLCSIKRPGTPYHHHKWEEMPRCKFTKLACPGTHLNGADGHTFGHMLVSVCGVLSPLVAARVQPGELQLTHSGERDYSRTEEALTRLESCSKLRPARGTQGEGVGNTMGSMESCFAVFVREDLHALGCAYRQLMVELLHVNILHFKHS